MIRTSRVCVYSRLYAMGRPQRVPPGMTTPARLGPYQFRNRKARLLAGRIENIPNVMKREHLRSDTSVGSLCNLGIGIWSDHRLPRGECKCEAYTQSGADLFA